MGTRCNIKLVGQYGQNTMYLYRHWDGYYAETGAHIAEKLMGLCEDWLNPIDFANALMSKCYEATSYQPARPMYELTQAAHGDIEYFYEIHFGNKITLKVASGYGAELERKTVKKSLSDFVDLCNCDRKQINNRITSMKQQSPEQYKDTDLYPMLEYTGIQGEFVEPTN
jgi:hypothetical protein